MNEKTLGIIMGVVAALVVAMVSISLTLFWIYIYQPTSVCELCRLGMNCSIGDFVYSLP